MTKILELDEITKVTKIVMVFKTHAAAQAALDKLTEHESDDEVIYWLEDIDD